MRKHTLRSIILALAAVWTIFYIYPTLGYVITRYVNPEKAEQLDKHFEQRTQPTSAEPGLFSSSAESIKRWIRFDPEKRIKLGLDLQGGIDMVLGLNMEGVTEERRKELEDVHMDIANVRDSALHRIWLRAKNKDFIAKEPVIMPVGNDQIRVQLPGEKDVRLASELIMKAAYLTFNLSSGPDETKAVLRKVDEKFENKLIPLLKMPDPTARKRHFTYEVPVENAEKVEELFEEAGKTEGILPEGKMLALSQPPKPYDPQVYQIYIIDKKPLITGEGLTLAAPTTQSGKWSIFFRFNAASSDQFAQVTRENIGRNMAIVLDGKVVSAPVIRSEINGTGEISGDFSQQEAKDLSIALNSGALPVPLKEEYTGVVGPSLGADSIQKGSISSLAALALVMGFMLWYYRMSGVVANVALLTNALMILAAMAVFRITLTMPGIAGLVLTMGMAVDGNVLIYERIREELRNGRSLLAAIQTGYERAQVTVLDTHITTLIAGVVLKQFGTGPIEGFAMALNIGIISTLFSNLIVARAMFDFLCDRKIMTDARIKMHSIFPPEPKIRFMTVRVPVMIASAVVIAISLMAVGFRGNEMMGVDFRNGTSMIVGVQNEQQVQVDSVRARLAAIGFPQAQVQVYSEDTSDKTQKFLVNIAETSHIEEPPPLAPPASPEGSDGQAVMGGAEQAAPASNSAANNATEELGVSTRVQQALLPLSGAPQDQESVKLLRVETVGASVGKELRWDAIMAVLWSSVFILIYIWFRFEIKFAVVAMAALVHDIFITLGAFALTGREITLPVIAAILTIIGFSLNDTIVVFDRVREDIKLYRGRGYTLDYIMERSINQTLSRTTLTSLTVLFTVVVLYFFFGGAIQDFAFAMIIGVVVGTYSSIYIASPFAYYWDKYFSKPTATVSADGETAGSRRRPQGTKRTDAADEATA